MNNYTGVLGQEPLKRRLQQTEPSHAYIFEGEPGLGKTILAKAFAKALECESEDSAQPKPCGSCLSCKVFDSGNHPDVFYVAPAKTKSIGVDDIREQILLPMAEKPFRYRYKIFIIPHAETLTPQAQNALLRTIEEPAGFGVFLFLAAHIRGFLKTVLSRCAVLKLKPCPESAVAEYLAQRGIAEPASAAMLSGGNPGYALKLAQSEEFAAMLQLANQAAQLRSTLDAYKLYPKFEAYKNQIQDLLDIMYMSHRQRLLGASSAEESAALINRLELITKTKRILQQNGNFQLAIELMLVGIGG